MTAKEQVVDSAHNFRGVQQRSGQSTSARCNSLYCCALLDAAVVGVFLVQCQVACFAFLNAVSLL